jgi:hypothetical protein
MQRWPAIVLIGAAFFGLDAGEMLVADPAAHTFTAAIPSFTGLSPASSRRRWWRSISSKTTPRPSPAVDKAPSALYPQGAGRSSRRFALRAIAITSTLKRRVPALKRQELAHLLHLGPSERLWLFFKGRAPNRKTKRTPAGVLFV